MERVEHPVEDGALALVGLVVFPHAAGVRQQSRDGQQLAGIEHTAALGAGKCLAHILHAGKRRTAAQADEGAGGVRFIL